MSIELTEKAADRVNLMLQQRGSGLGLRLGTRQAGCSGFAYVVDYADSDEKHDIVIESHGIKIFVNQSNLSYLDGMVVDYVRNNALNSGFEFRNPNVKNMCGCGESFTV